MNVEDHKLIRTTFSFLLCMGGHLFPEMLGCWSFPGWQLWKNISIIFSFWIVWLLPSIRTTKITGTSSLDLIKIPLTVHLSVPSFPPPPVFYASMKQRSHLCVIEDHVPLKAVAPLFQRCMEAWGKGLFQWRGEWVGITKALKYLFHISFKVCMILLCVFFK